MVGQAARVLLVIALLPRESAAQPFASAPTTSALLEEERRQSTAPPSPSTGKFGLKRGGWIALGTGIGFGAGLVFGEYYFGRHLDMPHGPDMIMGGGIGAGTGALIARLVTRNGSARSNPTLVPVFTARTKGVAVSFPLGARPPAAVAAKSP